MSRILIALLFTACVVCQVNGMTYFTSAMKVFRPGSQYRVTVTLRDNPSAAWATEVSLEVRKTKVMSATKSLVVSSGGAVTEEFILNMASNLRNHPYYLAVSFEKGGVKVVNRTAITLQKMNSMILIQTDKGIYKPGSLVQFRVVALNIALAPFTNSSFNIYLKDGKGNRIKQWLSVASDAFGVFSDEFQLDMVTPLGKWKIQVHFGTEKDEVTFDVEEYVLPRFEVTVKLPSVILLSDEEIPVDVDATYTYGEPVNGTAVLKAYLNGNTSPFATIIDDQKGLKRHLLDMRSSKNEYRRSLKVVVQFTDKLGGEKRQGTAQSTIHKHAYKVNFDATPKVIRPQLSFKVRGRLTRQDGAAPPANSVVTIGYKFTLSTPCYWRYCANVPVRNYKNASAQVDAKGNFVLDVGIPDNATELSLRAYYNGDVLSSHSVGKVFKTDSDQFIEVTFHQKTSSAVSFNVRTTFDTQEVFYQVMAKGLVVASGSQAMTGETGKIARITLAMNPVLVAKLTPKAYLVVVALYETEVIADSIQFNVDGLFLYQTTLSFNSVRETVGAATQLTVSTRPNAYVGLVAVDQSVLLLKESNDIDEDVVLNKLEKYYVAGSSGNKGGPGGRGGPGRPERPGGCPFCRRKKRSFIPWFPSQLNSHAILNSAGLVYLTNGKIVTYSYDRGDGRFKERLVPAVLPGRGSRKNPSRPSLPTATRSYFPETWLWSDKISGADGTAVFEATVPDSITSYVANAFALHADGLSVASPAKLQAFKSFYVTPRLPYSVVFGETFELIAVVYNYLEQDISVNVSLDTSRNEFDITSENIVSINVRKNSAEEVRFEVTPTKLKWIQIKLTAEAGIIARDTVIKPLLVKAEGKTEYKSKAYFVDRTDPSVTAPFIETFTVPFPTNVVPNTRRIQVVAMGDVMGPALTGLDKLVRQPTGCGEQNMVTLVPSISVRKYLLAMGGLTPELERKTSNFMTVGYQRELSYQKSDKSFSAFGDNDPIGSTWLTAFVLETFFKIDKMLPGVVDDNVLAGALNFILNKQNTDGSFREDGKVIHSEMQGGSAKGPTLTAYIYIMLLGAPSRVMNGQVGARLLAARGKTVAYLKNQLNDPKIRASNYALAIMALAFQTGGDSQTTKQILDLLEPRAITEGGKTHYEVTVKPAKTSSYRSSGPSSVEITGYILMTYTLRNETSKGLALVKWMLGMRNSNGGYIGTQDTVVGLESLAKFAAKVFRPSASTSLTVKVSLDAKVTTFTIDSTNVRLYQSVAKEEPSSNAVQLEVVGRGVALIQVSWSYNMKSDELKIPEVTVTAKGDMDSNSNVIKIESCFTTSKKNPGMYLLEMDIPSGYVADTPDTKGTKFTKAETKGDKVILYFQDVQTGFNTCAKVIARMQAKVMNRKPSSVIAYDYYNPETVSAATKYEPTTVAAGHAHQPALLSLLVCVVAALGVWSM